MTPSNARHAEINDELANLNDAINRQRNILLRTGQRTEHDRQIAAEAAQTVKSLEAMKAKLIQERKTGR